MRIDFSKKPDGATHFYHDHHGHLGSWWKVSSERSGPPAFVHSPLDGGWVAIAHVPGDLLPIPDHKPLINEGLPPLESTVRIVPGDARIWDVAEQFVGVDCRLKAVFMLGETRMVAVECIESGQCCCFWASMVRTPEQAKAEEREERLIAMSHAYQDFTGESPNAAAHQAFRALDLAGYRKQVNP